jgi:glycine/D-amino acid oxidase-like deaminating enzyme
MPEHQQLPASVGTLVIGAGVHGLSTAWHLARDGEDVLVVDKSGVAAGASGIACGVVRNNYFQPAMQELMAACVEVWESDPESFHYHGSGYIALGPPSQQSDLTEVYERQERIGYPSELHLGAEAVERHMRSLYADWRAPGLTVCLHEHAGGFAFNKESMIGLAAKAQAAGAQIVEQVVVAVGPWVASLWAMLGLPDRLDVRQPDGSVVEDLPMWTYWYLQEGEVAVDPASFVTEDGRASPVLHVDSDQPLRTDVRSGLT